MISLDVVSSGEVYKNEQVEYVYHRCLSSISYQAIQWSKNNSLHPSKFKQHGGGKEYHISG